jgi:hypothetical protein
MATSEDPGEDETGIWAENGDPGTALTVGPPTWPQELMAAGSDEGNGAGSASDRAGEPRTPIRTTPGGSLDVGTDAGSPGGRGGRRVEDEVSDTGDEEVSDGGGDDSDGGGDGSGTVLTSDTGCQSSWEDVYNCCGGGGGGGWPRYVGWLEREYVYGPDDVSEVMLQIDRDVNLIYTHQDANLNVVALTNTNEENDYLLEQYTWTPYGEITAAETLISHAVNKVGFQGLFADRLDDPDGSPLVPGATVIYQPLNRVYHPRYGRWGQRDPNETAQPLLESLA